METQSDRDAANKALDIAFRGDTSSIDYDMAQLFADHRAGCTCGGDPDQPADHHDISCPQALSKATL